MALIDDFADIAARMKGDLKPGKRAPKCKRCRDAGFYSMKDGFFTTLVKCTCPAGDAWLGDVSF